MVAQVTGGKQLPAEVLAQIVAKSDGIPLFVEELTKTVVEAGLLVDEGDHYALRGPLTPLGIPATLQDSPMARLDRSAPIRETAQIGAALGRDFSYELIVLVSPLTDNELKDALGQLVHSELINVRGSPPDAVYTFKHALVQDAAYETLLKARRQQLHLKTAKTVEERFSEIADSQPELMAHHYTAAGMSDPAISYWTKAARRAIEKSALAEAIAHLRSGLALVSGLPASANPPERELVLLNLLSPSLRNLKSFGSPDVRETCERAYRLAESVGDSAHVFPALAGLAVYHCVRGEVERALLVAQDMLQRAQAKRDHNAILQAHWMVTCNAAWGGRFQLAIVHWDLRNPLISEA